MTCCGAEQTTAFCPACGRNLRPLHTLDGLLAWLRDRYRVETRALKATLEQPSNHDWQVTPRPARIADRQRRVAKYQTWAEELEKLLAEAAQNAPKDAPRRGKKK